MDISEDGINFIKDFEKLELVAYLDQAGIPTIGYGHTATVTQEDVENGREITEEEAETLLESDLSDAIAAVNQYAKIELTQEEFDMLVSFAFNAGIGALANSTLLKFLNSGDTESAANQFLRWNKVTINGRKVVSNGLTRRRTAERDIFVNGYDAT